MFAFPANNRRVPANRMWYRSLPWAALAVVLGVPAGAQAQGALARAPGRPESPLSRPGPPPGRACGRPRLADDARREGHPAHERRGRHPAAGRAAVRVVERGPARRRPRGLGDRVPAGDRPRGHLRPEAHAARSRPPSATRGGRSTTSSRGGESARATRASRSGRRTSTSSATRAGAAGRRPTARIRSSPRAWASRSSRACRATTRST